MTNTGQRFVTLDVFRGLTIFLMIVVNTPGAGAMPFAPLMHAEWNGCTLTDLVFPSFLFAAGAAMPFAFKKWVHLSEADIWFTIAKRAVFIFVVGLLLTWYTTMHWGENEISFSSFSGLRIMAVLQRIALCYLFASIIVHFCNDRTVFMIGILLLFGYWLLLYLFGDAGEQYTITGNAVRKFDLIVLGERNMYKEKGIVFDPEGLLSTVPATVNVLAGYLASRFLIRKEKTTEVAALLLITGNILIVAAIFWNHVLPFNKKLWTSSYVVYTSGIDIVVTGILYYFIELRSWKGGVYFFQVFGRNPLFLYVLSNLFLIFLIMPVNGSVFSEWINAQVFQRLAPGPWGSLLFALCFTMTCWFVGWMLDKKRIYIRL